MACLSATGFVTDMLYACLCVGMCMLTPWPAVWCTLLCTRCCTTRWCRSASSLLFLWICAADGAAPSSRRCGQGRHPWWSRHLTWLCKSVHPWESAIEIQFNKEHVENTAEMVTGQEGLASCPTQCDNTLPNVKIQMTTFLKMCSETLLTATQETLCTAVKADTL